MPKAPTLPDSHFWKPDDAESAAIRRGDRKVRKGREKLLDRHDKRQRDRFYDSLDDLPF